MFDTWQDEASRPSVLWQHLQWPGIHSKSMSALSELSYRPTCICCHTDSSRSGWGCINNVRLTQPWWLFALYSESKWLDSCNSSELYSALAEWMKGAIAASSPRCPDWGLGRKEETRAPTKLLRDCPVTDIQCSRLIFAGDDRSHCELLICVLHTHKNWYNELQRDK